MGCCMTTFLKKKEMARKTSNQAIKYAHFVRRTSFRSAAYGRRYITVSRLLIRG